MKIAILTILDNWDNYGSVLQMLALKNWLTMLGNDVFVVNPPKRLGMIRREIINYIEDYKIDKSKSLYFLRVINKCIRIPYFAVKTIVCQTYNRFRYRKMFHRINTNNIENVDLVILGSDTLWDLENRVFRDSFYWGKELFNYDVPIVTYAVSCDNLSILDDKKYPWILECIPKFRHISVRDYHTRELVKPHCSKKVAVVCDPTLLCPDTLELKRILIRKRYLLIYAFELTDIEIECIKQFAKQENLVIVCAMGLRKFDFADINIDCGFDGFSSVVREASYVYTSTFHGCIFSIIHNKKAIYRTVSNKIADLINTFELSYRVFNDDMSPDQFSYIMKEELNIDKLNRMKNSFAIESQKYLLNVIDEVKREIC